MVKVVEKDESPSNGSAAPVNGTPLSLTLPECSTATVQLALPNLLALVV